MPIRSPKIDERTYETLVADLEKLAKAYTDSGWRPGTNGSVDAGGALIRIFSQMTETVIERINKVPEKNFLAFLDLIGTHVLPPRPARVPLTFQLAEGTTTDALVSGRTQIGATLVEGEEEEVNFETEEDLVVTPAQLKAVIVRQPQTDKYEDNTAKSAGAINEAFPVFEAEQILEHSLFLANDKLFNLLGLKTGKITIHTTAGDAPRLEILGLNWFYWDETVWQKLAINTDKAEDNKWTFNFQNPPPFQKLEIEKVKAKWLRASIDRIHQVKNIERGSLPPSEVQQRDLPFEHAFAGTKQLDLTQTFVPFTKSGDFFYLYLEPALADVPDDFVMAGGMIFSLDFSVPKNSAPSNVVLLWEFFKDDNGWRRLGESKRNKTLSGQRVFQFADNTFALTKSAKVTFELPTDKPVSTLNGLKGRWLRVKLKTGTYKPQINSVKADYKWELPSIKKIEIEVEADTDTEELAPDLALINSQDLDLSKDFYPFGERPRFNDAFFIKSDLAFATPGADVTIKVSLSDIGKVENNNVEIAWETYNGDRWQKLTLRSPKKTEFITTGDFTQDGEERFKVPDNITEVTVAGETGYWIRARIVKGDYGSEASYDYTNNQLVAPTLSPPSIKSLSLSYTHKSAGTPETCLQYHDFSYKNVTDNVGDNPLTLQPFIPTKDIHPTLYLGFDRAFSNRPMTLYAGVEPPLPGEISDAVGTILKSEAKVTWEYHGPEGWTNLGAYDQTNKFTERGLIKFIGPANFVSDPQFGHNLYWLRARWHMGEFRLPPRLSRLMTNTAWANQAVTIRNEMLGSGNGNPNQTLNVLRSPVLPGVRLEVREPELPSEQDLQVIKLQEGEDPITTVLDEAGQPEEIWVRWHEVRDFFGSGPQDRHYIMNHLSGEVHFGDGQNGMVPPLERNNIRIAFYRAGGGALGNRAGGTVTELKTTVPYVDSVTNHEPASGGAEKESLERVQERGPKTLRHRDRAVTAHDIEDLAYQASSDVARALAITPHFEPNDIQWLPIYLISPNRAGNIVVEITNIDDEDELQVGIYGPGQGEPYAETKEKEKMLSYAITQEQFEAGGDWRVEVRNLAEKRVSGGTLKITYPDGAAGTSSLDVPVKADLELADAGKIELIIVPDGTAELPTPTLNLINQVEDFILARCTPTMQLWVTEPDWVEVTVEAQLVPTSFKAADALSANVDVEIRRFLHPLTGGLDGRGWSFGRRPHESDLVALVESLDGVDHVSSFSVVSVPSLAEEGEDDDASIKKLPEDRHDRYLIYSGAHRIMVVAGA